MKLRWICENRERDGEEPYEPGTENWNLVDENNNILANVVKWNWADAQGYGWDAYGTNQYEYDEMLTFETAKKYAERYARGSI